jgi:tRNA modification GTPase
MTDDTIAAISTPTGEGGIAIVRVSGPSAFDVADAVFVSKRGRPSTFPSHTIHFGRIREKGNSVDQVMLSVMRAPRTYTTEDLIEINCHGGALTARTILSLCLAHGARLAEPGEFTKRAFLNGRLDLTQAEAVIDLIQAKTSRAHTAAVNALEGHLGRKLGEARDQLISIAAHIEAHIDFPEDDIDTGTRNQWLTGTRDVLAFLERLLATSAEGKILRHGLAITIIGRPNAGKSSLMNALLGEDRAIVTPIAGTTRDLIEEAANIRGIPIRLTDTAGIRKARGTIEELGIHRSHLSAQSSDLVLHVVDTSRPFTPADIRLTGLYTSKPAIQILSKCDLAPRLRLPPSFPRREQIPVSSTRGDGLENLRDRIEGIACAARHVTSEMDSFVNDRQADALRRGIKALTLCESRLTDESTPELVAQELRAGLDAIGEITGKTATEDILERVFSTFCIGK